MDVKVGSCALTGAVGATVVHFGGSGRSLKRAVGVLASRAP